MHMAAIQLPEKLPIAVQMDSMDELTDTSADDCGIHSV